MELTYRMLETDHQVNESGLNFKMDKNSSEKPAITNAKSSNVFVERPRLKMLARRSDKPGLIYLLSWSILAFITGSIVWLTQNTVYVWPAMFVFGVIVSVPAYSMSHETAHGTAFKTRWLNEIVFWITSLIYGEEPLHRRYTHTNHHTYTWHVGLDSQMPFDTPIDFKSWLADITGFSLTRYQTRVNLQLAFKRYTELMISVVPESELPRLTRNARIFLLIYSIIPILLIIGVAWPLWFLIFPRLLGSPVMLMFNMIQHVELAEDSPSILDSTRTFSTNWVGKFLYMNMNNHIEHHLYPQVPFYSLPDLHLAVQDQTPIPDNGFWKSNFDVLSIVIRRSRGKNTKANHIRQAAHMVSTGPYLKIAKASMQ